MNGTVNALAEEDALVRRAAAEPHAFGAIYDHYFPRVYNYVRYRVEDPEAADDLTAQVFERVLANLDRYRADRAPFGAWLFGIARHAVEDHRRAQARRRWLPLDLFGTHASPDPQPDEVADGRETRDELLAALAGLRERERDLIALKFAADMTNRDIARVTGLTESNVGVILFRALQQLRKTLRGMEVERNA